ncbi:MAG: DUF4824 family protein [Desulfuromonadales bacterium]|nr:DUF4824 family protein [Desulfuromonadales bacterium]
MKFLQSQRGLFVLGFLLLLVINGVVLGGVAVNRSGSPEAQVILTERELELPYRLDKENSGLSLHLDWRVVGDEDDSNFYGRWNQPVWFDAAKLKELGFVLPATEDLDDYASKRKSASEKEVFIVLEVNSPFFAKVISALETELEKERSRYALDGQDRDRVIKAEKRIQDEQRSGSRLFAVDAGLDAEQLRHHYGDRSRYVLTYGIVKHRWDYSGDDRKKKELRGYITKLSNGNIHVPRKFRLELEQLLAGKISRNNNDEEPRFQIELAYGSRFEPWVVAVQKTPK